MPLTTGPLLSVEDVAELLGLSTTWVYQRVRADEIPHIQLGGAVRFRAEDIENYLAKNTTGGTA